MLVKSWSALGLVAALAVGCNGSDEDPTLVYAVTVIGDWSDCITVPTGYTESFQYEVYQNPDSPHLVTLAIDGTGFASGGITGCTMQYTSPVWLEERDSAPEAYLRWQIDGKVKYQGPAGGCRDLPEGVDWYGTETITVVESGDETVPEGCTYEMEISGTLVP